MARRFFIILTTLAVPALLAAMGVPLGGLIRAAAVAAPAMRPAAEAATQPAAVVTFLDGQAAADAFVDDRMEPYFAKLAPHEMSAKTGRPITGDTPAAMREECIRRYRAAVRPFADDERAAVESVVSRVRPVLARAAPRLAAIPWTYIKVSDQLEFGFPHTRGGCIVLPERFVGSLATAWRRAPDAAPGAPILVHEFTHVAERAEPATFANLYEKRWRLRRAKSIDSNDWLASRQLLNPDGVACDWIFPIGPDDDRRWVLPLIAFRDVGGQVAGGRGINLIAVDLEPAVPDGTFRVKVGSDGTPVVKPLNAEPAYAAAFGGGANSYHPNEVAADLLAALVAEDLAVAEGRQPPEPDPRARDAERLATFRTWAKEAFKLPATGLAK